MGYSRWSPSDWTGYAKTNSTKKIDEVFIQKEINKDFDPKNITKRESRDSELNPNSTALIFGLDVTGSMGIIADKIRSHALGTLVNEILDRKPVSDPQIMFMGIGDCASLDRAPLQVSQFETDISMAKELEKIWLEKGGGGNDYESYHLPWYFASRFTSIDCFEKRNKKGYIFTIGDEEAPPMLTADQITKVFGKTVQSPQDYTSEQLLNMASKMYHVYHVVVEQGHHASINLKEVLDSWHNLIGQRTIRLDNIDNLAEVIVSTIQLNEGFEAEKIINSWSNSKSKSIAHAIKDLVPYHKEDEDGGSLIKF
jgi:hypothetical protein